MAPRLTGNVAVRHPETGAVVTLFADQVLPDWAADQVGDHVLDGPKSTPAALEAAGVDGEVETGEPPRSGAGSGKKAWAEYAAAQGIDVPDDASRDDIIAALEAAGVVAPEV